VFATRRIGRYDAAHLNFLNNIAQLITHSFGRTVKLAEHGRLAAIGEFASGIAHELRNPLATIGLALDYFSRLDLPQSGKKRARLAAQEAQRTNRLLEEMLLYAKPLQMRLEPTALIAALAEFLEVQHPLAHEREQRFELFSDLDETIRVMGDRDRLAQVWLNLTRNACEAAPQGACISWSIRDDKLRGAVEVEVRNPGPPIPDELLPRLTEPFFSTKPSGSGLGLSIVKRLINAHGGDVSIASDSTTGTRVTVTLPRLD
jgi:signal transduction histidine kinase